MPEANTKYELSNIEKQWVNKALETQRDNLRRSLSKELDGSEIHKLRKAEIEQLDRIRLKFT